VTRSVFIALGSNLASSAGDRLATLGAALDRLGAAPGVAVRRVSHAYETDPVPSGQPMYLNAAAELTTDLELDVLLDVAQSIERSLGRNRMANERWAARTIDVDILIDGESLVDRPGLAVPHPRLAERSFVLVPLAEIAPTLLEPRSGSTVRTLLASLRHDLSSVRRIGPIPHHSSLSPLETNA
jgi:2-amino-4-hydroxy-6-hydroxymethyldihydropteridine diphosphokinase